MMQILRYLMLFCRILRSHRIKFASAMATITTRESPGLLRICKWFKGKRPQKVPMPDLIRFAIATAPRASESIALKWADLNQEARILSSK